MRSARRVAILVVVAGLALAACGPIKIYDYIQFFFTCTGAPQSVTVPNNWHALDIRVYGADGGSGLGNTPTNGGPGGLGGFVGGTFVATPGETLTVNVGCRGGDANPSTGASGQGGYGGLLGDANGGAGGSDINGAGGGGGASDVRRGGIGLIGAGGGGGGGAASFGLLGGTGGGGGGPSGLAGTDGQRTDLMFSICTGGAGGAQSGAGTGGTGGAQCVGGGNGVGGVGGTGGANINAGGGGGGDYFAGGGGAGGTSNGGATTAGGGGGGSGFLNGAVRIIGEYFPPPANGHGYVVISHP